MNDRPPKPAKGDIIIIDGFSGPVRVRVLKVWPLGTADVESLDQARRWRVTGLGWS